MKNTCLKCGRPTEGNKKYCCTECRNYHVSEMMVRKAMEIKKKYGNKYYVSGKGFKLILFYAK